MKILVVDDNPDSIDLFCQILEEDYDVITAQNGPDGLALAREQQPDLVLLDVVMPEMDGYEVMRRLREDERTSQILVLQITAQYKDNDRVIMGLELGAFDYITKPIDDELLLAKVGVARRIRIAERTVSRANAKLVAKNEELNREISERKKAEKQIKQLNRDLHQQAKALQATNQELELYRKSLHPTQGSEVFET